MPPFHSGAAIVGPETSKLPPITEVVWEQPRESHSFNIQKTSTTETHTDTYMSEFRQRHDVESQTSPMKETSPTSIRILYGAFPWKSNLEHASTEPQQLQETSI